MGMTKTPQEIIIAALVAKLGGEVHISMREYEDAEDLELYRQDDPASFTAGVGFKVRKPPVILEGALANELEA
jgi:hypothetical protein